MTAPNKTAFQSWAASLPIPWLVAGPNGAAETSTWPSLLDAYVAQMIAARYCAYPDYAPTDALPHIGGDRQFIQGNAEPNASFQSRTKAAFDTWPRAGTACGVLEQLAYFGQSFGITNGPIFIQQNGLYFYLSAMPTPGQDPTSLVVSGSTMAFNGILTSSANTTRQIPANTPWWTFDSNTDLCNRFVVLYPTWPFSALAMATFSGSDSASVTWPVGFGSTSYKVQIGPPSDTVALYADATTQTTAGVTIRASSPWTGTAWVTAFATGVNPLNSFGSTSFGQMQRIISTFRPNSLCMGVFTQLSGRIWGWPTTQTWGSGTWGGSTGTILGAF